MATGTRTACYTFEDFCALIPDGQKADLIDGVIYMASPDNTDADALFMWLGTLLYQFVRRMRLGRVFGSRVAFRLDHRNGPEPDLSFVRKSREYLIKRGHVAGPPDVAVEIVSPDSIERDYEKKRQQYQEARVREYWIIDEIEQTVLWLRLDSKGKYREVKPRKGLLFSQVIEGFWLDPKWLWQESLPEHEDILKQLISGAR